MKQAALEEALSRAEQSKTQLERKKTDLNYTRITSPITGVVIDRKVDEADIGHIKAGQKVLFRKGELSEGEQLIINAQAIR